MKSHETPDFLKTRHKIHIIRNLDPSQILVGGFLLVIAISTLLLMLPISSATGEVTAPINALFTATSAVCVTGLVVVNTLAHWSLFGKLIILCCIQIGGLGFMTLVSMIFVILGKRITLKNRLIMQEALNFNTTAGIIRFTRRVVIGTFIVEGIGAALLSLVFIPQYGFLKGIFYSVFHSISAFCNAGFDLIGESSLTPFVGNLIVNLTIMSLIVLGGLGFVVWIDTGRMIRTKIKGPKNMTWRQALQKLPVHTKLVWLITVVLLVGGFLFFFFAEFRNPNTLGGLNFEEKIFAAMFHSVTTRTAGFNTIPLAEMTDASKIVTMLLMFIGGSPAGTAGGIKTVTIGILILTAISTIKGRENTVVFRRRISRRIILKALTITMIAILVAITMLIILSFTEHFTFMEISYEIVSALATVGITLGITSELSLIGKIIIIIAMFIGRLGPITMAVALTLKQNKDKGLIEYPEEKVMVG